MSSYFFTTVNEECFDWFRQRDTSKDKYFLLVGGSTVISDSVNITFCRMRMTGSHSIVKDYFGIIILFGLRPQ